MDKKIGTSAGLAIALTVAGTMALLSLKFYEQLGSFTSEVTDVPMVQNVVPVKTPPMVDISAQVSPEPTIDFVRSKYHLSFTYPDVFYRQKEVDGVSSYVTNFARKNVESDGVQSQKDDVQLSVVIKKGKVTKQDDMKELEQLGVVKIEDVQNPTIDGISASQYLLRVLRDDPGCDLRTDFIKDGLSYRVSLFSIGGDCEVVQRFAPGYKTLLQSFHVGK